MSSFNKNFLKTRPKLKMFLNCNKACELEGTMILIQFFSKISVVLPNEVNDTKFPVNEFLLFTCTKKDERK